MVIINYNSLNYFSPPTGGILHEQPKTKAYKSDVELGTGTLIVAECTLSWCNDETGQGFSIPWQQIGLHAVCKEDDAFPPEHLFLMVTKSGPGEDQEEDEPLDVNEDDLEDPEFGQQLAIRFVPEDKETLDEIFQAMSECQSLNPDAEEMYSEDEFLDADEEGEYILAGGDSGYIEDMNNLQISNGFSGTMEADGQFEDAEDDDDDSD